VTNFFKMASGTVKNQASALHKLAESVRVERAWGHTTDGEELAQLLQRKVLPWCSITGLRGIAGLRIRVVSSAQQHT